MRRWLINVALLCAKEFRSLLCDKVLIALIVFAFTGRRSGRFRWRQGRGFKRHSGVY